MDNDIFIPTTMARSIGNGVFFRPRRTWHTGVFAGEKLTSQGGDGSGCITVINGRELCYPPLTVTHRLYWHESNPRKTVSAFLSYPNAMGAVAEYFWEIWPGKENTTDVDRFVGENAESEMEAAIISMFTGE